jgi:hypothetical protein
MICVLELEKMIRHTGLFTEREERGAFSSFNNDIKNRTVITVSNPMRSGYVKELIDLYHCSCGWFRPCKIRSAKRQTVDRHTGRQANDIVREKRKKYEPLCNLAPPDKRLFFTPFVLESTGYLYEDSLHFENQ